MNLLFVCFGFPIIFDSDPMRKCLWTSLRIHIVTGFYMPLASLGMWIYGADSRNTTDPSLYKSDWPIRPPKVVQVAAKRKGEQAAWEKWSRPLDDLRLGVCKRATSRQPASDQQKAVNLTIPPTFICCQLPETRQTHKGLDNLFMHVSAFLVSFPFFSVWWNAKSYPFLHYWWHNLCL